MRYQAALHPVVLPFVLYYHMKLPGQHPRNQKLGDPPSRNFIAIAIWQGLAFLINEHWVINSILPLVIWLRERSKGKELRLPGSLLRLSNPAVALGLRLPRVLWMAE
ncbi:MAG: hypothetical protein OEZ07_04690 [Dehalococcoidia bacterium]|nr:hypothetical protein [Dehalococcoidia bacterium]